MIKSESNTFCNLEGTMDDGTGMPANLIFHFKQDVQKIGDNESLWNTEFCKKACVANLQAFWDYTDQGSLCCSAIVNWDEMVCAMSYSSTLEYDNDQNFLENYEGYSMYNTIF